MTGETLKLRGSTVGPCDGCDRFRRLEVLVNPATGWERRVCGSCRRRVTANPDREVRLSEVPDGVLR